MTLTARDLRTASGIVVELGETLGRGGEAKVHAVRGDPASAVKLYARPDAERARKLAAMIAKAPDDPDRKAGHVSIAWPRELLLDDSGRAVGFLMPRIDARRYLPLHQLYHPRSRRNRAPGISWRYLVRIARNLCGTLAALHDSDYVVGDLNESNILVDDRALVTLVDLDSIQVTSGYRTFRCNVGKGEYTPPELQGRSFRETNRKPSSDRFGLAVLVFLLLMEGNHPFAGVFRGKGEPPGLEENIGARRSPFFRRGPLDPPPAAPPLEIVGPELTALLKRALLAQPRRRPDARALKEALAALEADLVQCQVVPTHAYGGHLDGCPWCERAELLGNDPYPTATSTGSAFRATSGPATASRPAAIPPRRHTAGASETREALRRTTTRPTAAPAQSPGPRPMPSPAPGPRPHSGFRGSWPQFSARLPLLSLSLLALFAAPVYLWQAQLRALLGEPSGAGASQYAALIALVLLPVGASSLALYLRARNRPEFARALFVLERVVRAAVAAGLLSLLASLAAGLFLGRGSVLAGDWLLLPSFWVIAFVVSLRLVGPRRP